MQDHMKTLLLVEDDALLAAAEKRLLEKRGYRVIIARSGEEAVELVRGDPGIDLVLMDIELGRGIDGTEAAEIMLGMRDLPIVFLSSHSEAEVVEKTDKIRSYGYVVTGSSTAVFEASIKMAFRLFDAHRELARVTDKLEATLAALPDLLFEVGLDGTYYAIHAMNEARQFKPISEQIGKKIPEVLPRDAAETVMAAIAEAEEKGSSQGRQFRIEGPTGTRWIEVSVTLIGRYPDQPHFIFIARDFTERKAAETALLESRESLSLVLEASDLGYWDRDFATGIIRRNARWAQMLGYEPGDIEASILQWENLIHPDDLEPSRRVILDHLEGRTERYMLRYRLRAKRGGYRWILDCGRVVRRDEEGRPLRACGTHRDITDEVQDEVTIRNLLEEKDNLLKEVHHRVKNNMGTMMSFFSLQAEAEKDPAVSRAFRDAENCLASMGVLYEKLYRSERFEELSAREYLPALVREIVGFFPNGSIVRLDLDIGDFALGAGEMATLGILVNEIVTNAMKYAFVGRKAGLIRVSARESGGRVRLLLEDDGVGLPRDLCLTSSRGFGLVLVDNLARQLHGAIRLERGGGTRFILEFDRVGEPPVAGAEAATVRSPRSTAAPW
jgi:PAS domain S-box-containing protein